MVSDGGGTRQENANLGLRKDQDVSIFRFDIPPKPLDCSSISYRQSGGNWWSTFLLEAAQPQTFQAEMRLVPGARSGNDISSGSAVFLG